MDKDERGMNEEDIVNGTSLYQLYHKNIQIINNK